MRTEDENENRGSADEPQETPRFFGPFNTEHIAAYLHENLDLDSILRIPTNGAMKRPWVQATVKGDLIPDEERGFGGEPEYEKDHEHEEGHEVKDSSGKTIYKTTELPTTIYTDFELQQVIRPHVKDGQIPSEAKIAIYAEIAQRVVEKIDESRNGIPSIPIAKNIRPVSVWIKLTNPPPDKFTQDTNGGPPDLPQLPPIQPPQKPKLN